MGSKCPERFFLGALENALLGALDLYFRADHASEAPGTVK